MSGSSQPKPRVFESVSRRAYWIGIGVIVAGLIPLCWWAGWYAVKQVEENAAAQVQTNDPLTEILYSPLGNVVVLLVFQFFVANILFWSAAWVRLRFRG
ncbi:MAG: hypothetical protein AAGH99_13870 [Planctomycetota bacterium]